MAGEVVGFDEALGQVVRRIRLERGWSQVELAERAAAQGLPWDQSAVSRIETGRRAVAAPELFMLPLVLSEGGHRVKLPDLFTYLAEQHMLVRLTDWQEVSPEVLAAVARGRAPRSEDWHEDGGKEDE